MKKIILCLLPVAIMLLFTACGPGDSIEQATAQSEQQFEAAGIENMENDALFAAETYSANMLQVQLSQAALSRGVSPEVKDFAQLVESKHNLIQEELQAMAGQTNIVLPQTLGSGHQEIYNELSQKEGIAFDIEFIKTMEKQYDHMLKRYEDMAENGTSMEVKQYASRQLPLLRQLSEASQRLKDKIE